MNARFALFLIVLGSLQAAVVVPAAAVERSIVKPNMALQAEAGAIAKRLGAIKAINGNTITLAGEGGLEVAVTVQAEARVLRLPAGAKDLKSAMPAQFSELQVGDTIRVRGTASADGKSLSALEVLVITRSAVAAVSDQMRQDWQKRGIAGLVDSVDASAGTILISIPGLSAKRTLTIHVSKTTIIRRYAPESIKFEDAQPGTLAQIHPNDQLRARGDRSADGSEVSAEEIVTGKFPNVEGTIKLLDASAGVLIVQDLLSKKDVQLRISADSQLHKIPAETAQTFAAMLKRRLSGQGASGPGQNGASGSGTPTAGPGNPPGAAPSAGMPPAGNGPGGPGAGMGANRPGGGVRGAGDFQRMLDQTPAVTLAELHKGDAVSILATEGTTSSGGIVVKLYSGVEPILEAAPSGSQAMTLAPWSLGGAPGGEGGGNQ
jgi:uncharacterized protein DUF5666